MLAVATIFATTIWNSAQHAVQPVDILPRGLCHVWGEVVADKRHPKRPGGSETICAQQLPQRMPQREKTDNLSHRKCSLCLCSAVCEALWGCR